MITTFAVNEKGDIFRGIDGNLAMLEGKPAVLQLCAHAAKTLLGELVLAIDVGMPNFKTVWQGTPNIPQFSAALRNTLESVEGVTEVLELAVNQDGKTLRYSALIGTIYGPGTLNGNL